MEDRRGQTQQERRLLRRRGSWYKRITWLVKTDERLRHLTEERIQAIIASTEEVIAAVSYLGSVDEWSVEDMKMLLLPLLRRIVHDSDECNCNRHAA